MVLFINACNRKHSRTLKLANYLLDKLDDEIKTVNLYEIDFPKTDEDFINYRSELIKENKYDDELFDYANDFSKADIIVIAAPYWDLSFPACLKQYFEIINVLDITFKYSDDGYPIGICKAKTVYYITTSGGEYVPDEFGYGYVKALSNNFYGIDDIKLVKVTGLDIIGPDIEEKMNDGLKQIDELFK